VCDPELIQQVLLDQADAFRPLELQQRGFRPFGPATACWWSRGPTGAGSAGPPRPPSPRVAAPDDAAFAAAADASTRRLCAASGSRRRRGGDAAGDAQVVMDTLLASYDGAVPDVLARTLFGDVVVRPTALDLMGAPAWIPAPAAPSTSAG
jgi:hypothetical protein